MAEDRTSRGATDAAGARGWLAGLDRFQRRNAWAAFPVAVVRKYRDDEGGAFATEIAYYGFFSVFPLMLVFVTVLGIALANDPELQERIIDSALARFPILGPTIAEEVHAISGNPVALTFGLATALWAGLGVLRAMQRALGHVWDLPSQQRPGFIVSSVRGVVVLLVLGTAIVASTLLAGLATAFGTGGIVRGWELAVSLAFNVGIFVLAFRVLGPGTLRWRDVSAGAITAGALWTLLQAVGGLYVTHTIRNATNVYGTFALVIGLLVWIHLAGRLTVLCAEIDVVRVRRLWPKSLA